MEGTEKKERRKDVCGEIRPNETRECCMVKMSPQLLGTSFYVYCINSLYIFKSIYLKCYIYVTVRYYYSTVFTLCESGK